MSTLEKKISHSSSETEQQGKAVRTLEDWGGRLWLRIWKHGLFSSHSVTCKLELGSLFETKDRNSYPFPMILSSMKGGQMIGH